MNSLTEITGKTEHPAGSTAKSIGTILVDEGRLSAEASERTLKLQQEAGLRFGDAAVQLGLISEDDVQQALAQQYGYAYLLPEDTSVSHKVVAAFRPFAPQAEQLRALRSQLMSRWFAASEPHKALAILSPEAGEGRSFVAANLAVVFAQLGERTLLVDADLRNPQQHELFKLPNRLGLSSVLVGRADITQAIVPITGITGLSVLPAGAVPPNPQELLGRAGFHNLMADLCEQYDIVLLDTSAAAATYDAQAVAAWAGGALIVARENATSVRVLQSLIASLQQLDVNVVGSLLNKF